MSIADEITRIEGAKSSLKTSIQSKGVQVPSSAKIDSYSGYVDQIQTGGGTGINWSQIGYADTPQGIVDAFNYAKTIYDNWNSATTSMQDMFRDDKDLVVFPFIDTSNVTNMIGMCREARALRVLPLLDTSKVTTVERAFASVCVKDFPLFDFSKVTKFVYTFNNNKCVITLPAYDTSVGTSFDNFASSCDYLANVPEFDLSSATNLNSMFSNCTRLSNQSLENILNSLLSATVYTGEKTLKKIGLSSSQATICQGLSPWTELSTDGWTTGY